MAKQNSKSSHSKLINKSELSSKLDSVAKNVANRGLFFTTKQKTSTYSVIDVKTSKPVFVDIMSEDIAYRISACLNKTPIKNLPGVIPKYKYVLSQYDELLLKHYNDIMVYSNTINTTTDEFRLMVAESRLELSTAILKNLINKIVSKIIITR
jgi:hypothetical protein